MGYSIVSALLIFYLVITNCLCQDLLAKQMKTWLTENRIVRHIMALIMLLVIIILLADVSIEKSILYAIFGYLLFLFTTKLDIQFNVMIFILLLLGFFYESFMKHKEEQITNDPVMTFEDKMNAKNQYINKQRNFHLIIIAVTIIGTYLYFNRKKDQYGQQFSYIHYILY